MGNVTFNQTSYRIISGISFALSFPSLIGSSYIIYSWHRSKKHKNQRKNDLLNDYVAYMSMADFLLVSFRSVYVSNPAFKLTFISKLPDWLCGVFGAIHNFSAICTTTLNFVIVTFILIPMSNKRAMFAIAKQRRYHLALSCIICIIVMILPFLTPNEGSYGFTDNAAEDYGLSKYQCWIENKNDYFCFYGFIIFYFVWSVIVLLYTFCVMKQDKTIRKLTSKLVWYSLVFVFVWSGPITDRMYRLSTDEMSVWLVCYHWICIHCVGWTNAAVWYTYIKPSDSTVIRYQSMDMELNTVSN